MSTGSKSTDKLLILKNALSVFGESNLKLVLKSISSFSLTWENVGETESNEGVVCPCINITFKQ